MDSNAPHSEDEGVSLDGLAVAFEDKVAVAADYVEPAEVHLGQQQGRGSL